MWKRSIFLIPAIMALLGLQLDNLQSVEAVAAPASGVRVLTITGEDPSETWVLEDTIVRVIPDARGNLSAISVKSEDGTVNQAYTLAQLQGMRSAPVKFSGVTVLLIDGTKMKSTGGELVLRYPKNAVNPFNKTYGVFPVEIVQSGSNWLAFDNRKSGRRQIRELKLVLNVAAGVPVGVSGVISK